MALISGQSEWTTRAVREDPTRRERETQRNGLLIARKMTIPVGKEAASGKKWYLFACK